MLTTCVARLPPLFALRALEAAARHKSYSGAAQELAVTHGAVSQQIRKLEDEFGARLFVRRGNRMMPTAEAARLAERVGGSLAEMQAAVEEFAQSADCGPLVISLVAQFGTHWLPPRLPRLVADPAGANLEFRIEDRLADFVTDGVDVGVRYGRRPADGAASSLLFEETLFPVCSPELAAKLNVRTPQDLLAAPLLRHARRPWRLWFSALGLEEPPTPAGPVFEDSWMLVEAAVAGLGVALARSSLVSTYIADGRLARLLPHEVESDFAYYVVWRPDSPKLRRILAFRDWLTAEAAASGEAVSPDD